MKTIKQIFAKSILGIAVVALFLFTTSCSQESVLEPIDNLEAHTLKSPNAKKATRAIRGKINNDATTSDIPPNMDCGFPLSANDIFGNMTHLGKIQPESYGIPIFCEFAGPLSLNTVYLVNYIGAHGDEIQTREMVTITFDDDTFFTGSFDGDIEIIGGTGRFEEATGHMVFVDARFEGSVSTWEVVGEITY